MRTAIFLGLTAIADAIREDWLEDKTTPFVTVMVLVMMSMDIIDFAKNKSK